MLLQDIKNYRNKPVAILGYGREGKSTFIFLQKLGFSNITILDKNKIIEQQRDIKYIDREEYLDQLDNFELIIKSPGISPYNEKIAYFKGKITSQTEIFCNNFTGKIIGITGTKGKSTTSTVLYLTLKSAGFNTQLVGNIGSPVLDEINILEQLNLDFVVYEMSSYMLEGIHPHLYIGYINNIFDCHLDWHSGRSNYQKAKQNIFTNSAHKISNIQTQEILDKKTDVQYFGSLTSNYFQESNFYIDNKALLEDKNIKLQGIHNRENIIGILTILKTIDPSFNVNSKILLSLKENLSHFDGLPHRIQNIGTYKEIIFIDDAIATTPESTIAAINTFQQQIGTLFLGGQDSGFNFEVLRSTILNNGIKNIVLFPDTGESIFGDLSEYEYEKSFIYKDTLGGKSINILKTKKMTSAVDFAFNNTEKGKICLLSNAAPSFSLWKSYTDKGSQFQEAVKKQGE